MNGNLVKSILGLTLTTVVVTGGVVGVSKMQENKGVASDNPEAIVLETDKVADETLSAENENELLSLEKLNEEESNDLEETELTDDETEVKEDGEEVTDETEETDKKEETTKPSEKKEEAKAETTTETVAETTTETTSEQPSETVEQPSETTTTETVAETQTAEPVQPTAWSSPFASMVVDNPQNDSERLHNEMYSASSQEEFERLQEELANTAFDINGNVVDPSMIVVEPEPSTTTEVIEEIEVTE